MIPLRSSIRARAAPLATLALLAANVLVFFHEASLGGALPRFVQAYGLVPLRFVAWAARGGDPWAPERFVPLLTSMFWHAGWLHLIGNMLYLWIFGDALEDRLGHLRFLAFYLLCGLAAGLAQVALQPSSPVPTVGASGAVAGVLGATLVCFPRSRVLTFVPLFFLPWFAEIPAVVFLALWFVLQLLSGLLSLDAAPQLGGVAFWAHVGGFVAGMLVALVLPPRRAADQSAAG